MVLKNTELTYKMRKNLSNILLLGLSGSGKSVIGKQIARRLGFGFLDLDLWIQKSAAGRSVKRIFSEEGESGFRDLEARSLEGLRGIISHVIPVGAGAVELSKNRQLISDLGISVWIDPPLGVIASRLARDPDELRKRPLLAELAAEASEATRKDLIEHCLNRQLERRREGYLDADLIFQDGFALPDDAALRISQMLVSREFQSTLRRRIRGAVRGDVDRAEGVGPVEGQ